MRGLKQSCCCLMIVGQISHSVWHSYCSLTEVEYEHFWHKYENLPSEITSVGHLYTSAGCIRKGTWRKYKGGQNAWKEKAFNENESSWSWTQLFSRGHHCFFKLRLLKSQKHRHKGLEGLSDQCSLAANHGVQITLQLVNKIMHIELLVPPHCLS